MDEPYITGLREIEAFVCNRIKTKWNEHFCRGYGNLLEPLRVDTEPADWSIGRFPPQGDVDASWSIEQGVLEKLTDAYAKQVQVDYEANAKSYSLALTFSPNADAILFGGLVALAERSTEPDHEIRIERQVTARWAQEADAHAWYAVASIVGTERLPGYRVFQGVEAKRRKAAEQSLQQSRQGRPVAAAIH
jgi:hypothetical protein